MLAVDLLFDRLETDQAAKVLAPAAEHAMEWQALVRAFSPQSAGQVQRRSGRDLLSDRPEEILAAMTDSTTPGSEIDDLLSDESFLAQIFESELR